MERYMCIHGHFYQPPRENPWLEAIEVQDSAHPYHDWNERITAECYAPNAASRILDGNGRILDIVNNYSRISFNFGPTLLAWLERQAPAIHQAVIDADASSRERFTGHGSAIAQAYNHMILPLANRRDRYTQVYWGIRDFRHRFGRYPEGMWLPEAAVDIDTLNTLAEFGIRFTVLSPHQAARVRPLRGPRHWNDVSGGRVDPSMPYRVILRSGNSMDVFFYDGPISQAVAFEGLLMRGEYLADRMASAFSDARTWPQLVHIATDGETYGHHHHAGDMALAYAVRYIEERNLARLTNYAEFLHRYPPTHEAQIFDNSSWSCCHGVERWRSHCGCASGGRPEWNQQWRAPLRRALDWLRDSLVPLFTDHARKYLRAPWGARNEYISVILDRSATCLTAFFDAHSSRNLSSEERIRVLKLMEMQRHAMLMYTSCGWFFDEISGLETVQVLQYAGRALQLASELFYTNLERGFLDLLAEAKSNLPEHQDGRQIFEKFVRPAMLDLGKVVAHYSISSLFGDHGGSESIYCYEVDSEDQRRMESGRVKFVLGRTHVTSTITHETAQFSYGVLHLGEQNISGGVGAFNSEEQYGEFASRVADTFQRGNLIEIVQTVFDRFGANSYNLNLLFRDEQRRIVRLILEDSLQRAESAYRQIHDNNAPFLRFVRSLHIPLPKRFRLAADFVINADLRRAFETGCFDRVPHLLEEARLMGVALDETTLAYALRRTIDHLANAWALAPTDTGRMKDLSAAVAVARSLPFRVNLWTPQNVHYEMRRSTYPDMRLCAENGDPNAGAWKLIFRALGENLSFSMDWMPAPERAEHIE